MGVALERDDEGVFESKKVTPILSLSEETNVGDRNGDIYTITITL